jgi:hypothetical protein
MERGYFTEGLDKEGGGGGLKKKGFDKDGRGGLTGRGLIESGVIRLAEMQ